MGKRERGCMSMNAVITYIYSATMWARGGTLADRCGTRCGTRWGEARTALGRKDCSLALTASWSDGTSAPTPLHQAVRGCHRRKLSQRWRPKLALGALSRDYPDHPDHPDHPALVLQVPVRCEAWPRRGRRQPWPAQLYPTWLTCRRRRLPQPHGRCAGVWHIAARHAVRRSCERPGGGWERSGVQVRAWTPKTHGRCSLPVE